MHVNDRYVNDKVYIHSELKGRVGYVSMQREQQVLQERLADNLKLEVTATLEMKGHSPMVKPGWRRFDQADAGTTEANSQHKQNRELACRRMSST